jgi:hypothetical protein
MQLMGSQDERRSEQARVLSCEGKA